MSRRTRRVQAQARVRERMEAEEQARRDSATTDGAEAVEGGAADADGPADGEPTDGTDGDPRPAADPEGPTPDDRR
eukprot:Nk52_evm1s1358 gene=Nk52_evmTU1s1358